MILKLNILLFTAVSAWMDLKWRKVKNFWIVMGLAGGVFYRIFSGEYTNRMDAAVALILPLILFGWLYRIRKMGAGDIKMFMVVGLWLGSERLLKFVLFAMAAGTVYFLTLFLGERSLRAVLKRKVCVAVCAFVSAVLFTGGVYS